MLHQLLHSHLLSELSLSLSLSPALRTLSSTRCGCETSVQIFTSSNWGMEMDGRGLRISACLVHLWVRLHFPRFPAKGCSIWCVIYPSGVAYCIQGEKAQHTMHPQQADPINYDQFWLEAVWGRGKGREKTAESEIKLDDSHRKATNR